MKVGIFDLETTGFYADSAILLCACVKEYGRRKVTTLRADEYPTWKSGKSNDKALVEATIKELKKYDILVAHNGQYFDKAFLNAKCLQYGIRPSARWIKFIDPVLIARRHLKLGRNSLAAVIDFLDIPVHKTRLELKLWQRASLDGDRKAMDTIVEHCVKDVQSLDLVYDKVRVLVDKVDNKGSSY